MSGFFPKDPASVRGMRPEETDTGPATPGVDSRGGIVSTIDGPNGTVTVDDVLSEEAGKYGPAFILRLIDFLAALGTSSPKTIKSVHLICETVLRQHIGSEGSFSLHGGGGGFFVFRFGQIGNAEAMRRAKTVVNEIGQRLLGDRFVPAGNVDASVETAGQMQESEPFDEVLEILLLKALEATENDWVTLPAENLETISAPNRDAPEDAHTRQNARDIAREGLSNGETPFNEKITGKRRSNGGV
ncbi:MAG: hypothetical protein ISR47_06820 [Rhodospirillales bacterium]|nr:hypothetical protein [Rhodospirillales bacterium]